MVKWNARCPRAVFLTLITRPDKCCGPPQLQQKQLRATTCYYLRHHHLRRSEPLPCCGASLRKKGCQEFTPVCDRLLSWVSVYEECVCCIYTTHVCLVETFTSILWSTDVCALSDLTKFSNIPFEKYKQPFLIRSSTFQHTKKLCGACGPTERPTTENDDHHRRGSIPC